MKTDLSPLSFPFSQEHRLFQLESPVGSGLLLDRFQGSEGLSTPFRFQLQLLSERADLALEDLIGVEWRIRLAAGAGDRWFGGHVTRFARTGADGGFARYEATLGPWTDFLDQRINCRIFHDLTLPELIRSLFGEYGGLARYQLKLAREAYPPVTHRTQYCESDFAFLSRLLEAHGIHYHFRFGAEGHTLVLADDSRAAEAMPVRDRIAFHPGSGEAGADTIDRWERERRLVPTAYAIRSFDFQNPGERLEVKEASDRRLGASPPLERYEHAGPLAFPGHEAGRRLARLRVQEAELRSQTFHGAGTCRFLTCGHSFELLGQPGGAADPDRRFLVTAVTHEGGNNYRDTGGKPYRNQFTCVRAQAPFRPPLATPRPLMPGPQTATVVGPPGEEIFCDRYGRVRVQFHWDREGTFTEASSCWVRVASPWAGEGFGVVAVPRVGQEVLVAFLEGNPDRPIVTGSAYNESNPPPWELPANRTQSGILTRSAGGGAGNANALRFEDRPGAEEVWLHAEKDQRIEVEHDESHRVDHDRAKTIGHDETAQVRHDRTVSVGHDEAVRIGHDRAERVGADESVAIGGSQRLSVGGSRHVSVGATQFERVLLASNELVGGARTLSVGAGYGVTVGAGKNEAVGLGSFEEVGADKRTRVGRSYHIEAGDRLEIIVGHSRLVLAADGTITLAGVTLQLTGSDRVQLEGRSVDLN